MHKHPHFSDLLFSKKKSLYLVIKAFLKYVLLTYDFNASAPPTISKISLVIAA